MLSLDKAPVPQISITNSSFTPKYTFQVLVKFILQWAPKLQFTTVSVVANGNKGPHRDLGNFEGFSFLTCLTRQPGGNLWAQNNAEGQHAMVHHGHTINGEVWDIQHRPILVQSHTCIVVLRGKPRFA